MKLIPRTIALPAIICCVLLAPGDAYAQLPGSPGSFELPVARADQSAAPRPARSRGRGVVIGALVGAGAALVVTGVAAARYGENEGGKFCGVCMVQWSAFTVPVGAVIGAGIGYGIERSRRSIAAGPMLTRRSAGIMISARF